MLLRGSLSSGLPIHFGTKHAVRADLQEQTREHDLGKKSDENSMRRDFRDLLWVAFPKLLGGALQLIFNILLLRHLGPQSFGMLAVCLSAVILCDSIFGSAIDMSIFRIAPLYRTKSSLSALQVQQAGLLLKPAGALLAVLPIALFAPRISLALFQRSDATPLLYLTLGALLGTLLIRSTQVHFQIERKYKPYGLTDVINNVICFGAIGMLLAARIYSNYAILLVYAAVPIAVSIVNLTTRARAIVTVPVSTRALRTLGRTLQWFLPTVVIGSILSRMDVFFVSGFAGVSQAGIYSAAQIFALLPALMGLYMSAVFSPRIMALWQEGKLKRFYIRYQAGLVALAVLIFLSAMVYLNSIAGLLLPASYHESTGVILALLPAGLCSMITFPLTIPLLLYSRPKVMLLIDCVGVLILAPIYITVARHGGALGVAKLTSGVMLLRTLIHQWLAWRVLDVRTKGAVGSVGTLLEEELSAMGTV